MTSPTRWVETCALTRLPVREGDAVVMVLVAKDDRHHWMCLPWAQEAALLAEGHATAEAAGVLRRHLRRPAARAVARRLEAATRAALEAEPSGSAAATAGGDEEGSGEAAAAAAPGPRQPAVGGVRRGPYDGAGGVAGCDYDRDDWEPCFVLAEVWVALQRRRGAAPAADVPAWIAELLVVVDFARAARADLNAGAAFRGSRAEALEPAAALLELTHAQLARRGWRVAPVAVTVVTPPAASPAAAARSVRSAGLSAAALATTALASAVVAAAPRLPSAPAAAPAASDAVEVAAALADLAAPGPDPRRPFNHRAGYQTSNQAAAGGGWLVVYSAATAGAAAARLVRADPRATAATAWVVVCVAHRAYATATSEKRTRPLLRAAAGWCPGCAAAAAAAHGAGNGHAGASAARPAPRAVEAAAP